MEEDDEEIEMLELKYPGVKKYVPLAQSLAFKHVRLLAEVKKKIEEERRVRRRRKKKNRNKKRRREEEDTKGRIRMDTSCLQENLLLLLLSSLSFLSFLLSFFFPFHLGICSPQYDAYCGTEPGECESDPLYRLERSVGVSRRCGKETSR